ncbi:hypothetical protein K1719_016798 [Acacia pycnantha]|nr:hypothetical protein K1719_016798 [Acacia pycnantha]
MEIVKCIAEMVAEPIIEYTVAPIARQVRYLIFYKDNFKNLKDQYTELKRVKGTISHEVEVERKNGRKIYDAAQNWLNRVDEIVEEAEQLSNDPRHRNVVCCKWPFPNFKSRHQLSRKAKKMVGNIAEVMQYTDKIRPLAFLPELEGVGFTSITGSEKLESRKKMKDDIVLALRDPNISRVGVYGLGGVGKSTLVKEVAKQVEDDKVFDKVVIANISHVADLERIQREIADFLGLHFEETTIIGRAARLRQRIKDERSILVILDDIWEILELDKLGLPLNDHKGCKLLLISRKLDILKNMETQKDFLIGVLNEEEAWSLFEEMVGDVVKDANLRDVAIQVAQKCAGLIVLIVTVARALKNKDDIDSWKDALNQLKTVDEEGMSEKIYSALKFSYNHLDGDDVKALFLLCGSIGPEIFVEYLLKYGMGLGIFKHINTTKDARLKLHRLIGSLKASCLLLEDNSNMEVKMHDVVQEVAISIASRDNHVFKIGSGENSFLNSVAVDENIEFGSLQSLTLGYLPAIDDFYSGSLESSTTTMQSFSFDNNVPSSFINSKVKFSNLETLKLSSINLENIWQDDHVSIANSFHKLANLSVEGCRRLKYLFSSSMVGSFANLKQLEIRECEMMEEIISIEGRNGVARDEVGLPKLETFVISNMKRLRKVWHSQFDGLKTTEIFMQRPLFVIEEVIPKLKNWTLKNKEAIMILEDPQWKDLYLGKLNALRLYRFEYKAAATFLDSVVQKAPNLKVLVVSNSSSKEIFRDKGVASKEGKNEIKTQLQTLSLYNVQLLHICREGCQVDPILEVLELLYVTECDSLKILVPSSVTFSHLTDLEIEKCNGLINLIYPSTASSLVKLKEMILRGCNSLEEIVTEEMNETRDEIVLFLSLRTLVLESLPRLNCFSSSKCLFKFPFLEKVVVRQCPRMKMFCETETSAPMLKKVIKDGKDGEWCWEGNLNETITKIFLDKHISKEGFQVHPVLEMLEYLWVEHCSHLKHLVPSSVTFSHLTHLEVENCNGLIYLITSSTARSLVKLTTMKIKNCNSLEQVVAEEREGSEDEIAFNNLEVLELECMPMIKRFCSSNCVLNLQWLEKVVVQQCPRMSIFSVKDTSTPMLQEILSKEEDEKRYWEGDLNRTINKMFVDMVAFHSFKHLKLAEYPELRGLWLIRLAPPLTSFTNLITLEVEGCNGMMDFMSPFTAKSLVHLTHMTVRNCGMLEEVVMSNEGGPEEEIIFKSLKYLELTCLPRFKSFCFGKHTFIFPSLVTLIVTGCPKMQNFSFGITVAPFLKLVEVETGKKRWKRDLNTTINHLFLEKANEKLNMDTPEASSSKEQVGQSKPNQIADIRKQDTQKNEASSGIERPHAQVTQNGYNPCTNQDTEANETIEKPLIQIAQEGPAAVQDIAIGTQEIHDTMDKPLIQTDQDAEKLATTQNTEESLDVHIETQKICDTINRPPIPTAQNVPNSNMICEAGIGKQDTQKNEAASGTERPQAQVTQNGYSPSTNQDTELIGLARGTQEMSENIERSSIEAAKVTGAYDARTEKPLIQIAQAAQRPAVVQDTEGSRESKACPGENLFNQPKTFITDDKIETSGTQEIHDTIDKPFIQSDQDAEKLATTQNTAIDPSPSQAPELVDLSMQKLNIYKNYKGMIDIPEQNMPYLEVGVNRHPQVLDWLNTKRRRVFTCSFFSLFADVTRILRTTRKVNLTEDDRNYIRECCTVLEGVGFDESWINYVHGCIEECGDGEDLKRKVEEAEGQASNLKDQIESMKKELASVEESLVLLRGKASKLHDFIES